MKMYKSLPEQRLRSDVSYIPHLGDFPDILNEPTESRIKGQIYVVIRWRLLKSPDVGAVPAIRNYDRVHVVISVTT